MYHLHLSRNLRSLGFLLAMLATLDASWLAAEGHSAAELCGLVGISGVYDVGAEHAFLRQERKPTFTLEGVMRGTDNYAAASPLTYARADLPPVLLVHGEADTSAPSAQSVTFDRALRAAGAHSELVLYPGRGHAELLFYALSDPAQELVSTVVDWVRLSCQTGATSGE